MAVRLLTTEGEIERSFATVSELRPRLAHVEELLALVQQMRLEGAEIAALEHAGEIATVAFFRTRTLLATGKTMYVDDLVTAARFRSQGHGKQMLDWLMERARAQGCETFSLDSGTFRPEAHAFYFREGMRITSFHFECRL